MTDMDRVAEEAHRALDTAGPVVHCLTGNGEWDLDRDVARVVVDGARQLEWIEGRLGHDLCVTTADGLVLRFAVKKPERAT